MRTNYAKFLMDYRCLLTRWLRNRNARWRMAGRLANLFHIWASDARQPTLALFENSTEARKGVFCLLKNSVTLKQNAKVKEKKRKEKKRKEKGAEQTMLDSN